MLGSDPPPPPPRHGRKGSPSPNPPPGTATKEGEGGFGQMGFRAIPPAKQVSSRLVRGRPYPPAPTSGGTEASGQQPHAGPSGSARCSNGL